MGNGYQLMSDQSAYRSGFVPLFNTYLSKGYLNNPFYQKMNSDWIKADKLWWQLNLNSTSNIWGKPVENLVWGMGAGPGPNGYYYVDAIDDNNKMITSAAIMAGFLPFADTEEMREEINSELETMYTEDICSYPVTLSNSDQHKILWRCSVKLPDWRCPSVDSIDFSTMILGYSTNFLPADFYQTYAP